MSRPNLYDYLKVFAILTMIIDHIGYFLFPEILWLRVIGRLAFPVFFFLIGRNGSSRISYELIFLACFIQWILRWASMFMGYNLRQLNILPVAILVKLFLGWISYIQNTKAVVSANTDTTEIKSRSFSTDHVILFLLMLIGLALIPRTKDILEYGTVWFIMALFGYSIKNKERFLSEELAIFSILSLCSCILINSSFPFTDMQWRVLLIGWIVIWYHFITTDLYRTFTAPMILQKSIMFLSRYAIRVYIIHFSILLSIVIIRRS